MHRQEVWRAVLEGFAPLPGTRQPILHGHELHRSAAEVIPPQHGQRIAARDQRTHAGRITEQFVERQHGKVRRHGRQRERVAPRKGGGVEEHTIASVLRVTHQPRQWRTPEEFD